MANRDGGFVAKAKALVERCPDPKHCGPLQAALAFCNRFDISIWHPEMLVEKWQKAGPNGRGTLEREVDKLLRLMPKKQPRKLGNRRELFVA